MQEHSDERGLRAASQRLDTIRFRLAFIIAACVIIGLLNLLYVLMLPSYLDSFVYVDSVSEYVQVGLLICLIVFFTLASVLLAMSTLLTAHLSRRARGARQSTSRRDRDVARESLQ